MENVVKCAKCEKYFGYSKEEPKCRFCNTHYGAHEEENKKIKKVVVNTQKESFKIWKT